MFILPTGVRHVAEDTYRKLSLAGKGASSYLTQKNPLAKITKKEEENVFMKKSTLVTIIAFLAAAAGALAVAFCYLRRREAELDDFEDMLFYDDYYDDYAEEVPAPDTASAESAKRK